MTKQKQTSLQPLPQTPASPRGFEIKNGKISVRLRTLRAAARAADSDELFTPSVMVQRSKTVSGVRMQSSGEGAAVCAGAEAPQGHLQGMVSEVVSLLNEQAFARGHAYTEREVCESFSEILLRH